MDNRDLHATHPVGTPAVFAGDKEHDVTDRNWSENVRFRPTMKTRTSSHDVASRAFKRDHPYLFCRGVAATMKPKRGGKPRLVKKGA